MVAASPNSGHTAPICSAKISLRETSYVRKTLSEMPKPAFEKEAILYGLEFIQWR